MSQRGGKEVQKRERGRTLELEVSNLGPRISQLLGQSLVLLILLLGKEKEDPVSKIPQMTIGTWERTSELPFETTGVASGACTGSPTGVPTDRTAATLAASSSSLSSSSAAGTSRSFASGSAVVVDEDRMVSLTFSMKDAGSSFLGSTPSLLAGGGRVADEIGGGRVDLGVGAADVGADWLKVEAGAGGAATGVAPSSSETKLGSAVLPDSHSSAVKAGLSETAGGKMSLYEAQDVGSAHWQNPSSGLQDSRLEVLRLSRNDEGQGLDSAA